MTVPFVAASSGTARAQASLTALKFFRQGLNDLQSALEAADVQGAATAFASVRVAVSSANASGRGTVTTTQLEDPTTVPGRAFKAVGQALVQGDVPATRQAFALLLQAIDAAQGGATQPNIDQIAMLQSLLAGDGQGSSSDLLATTDPAAAGALARQLADLNGGSLIDSSA
jgi:hypothetical protein